MEKKRYNTLFCTLNGSIPMNDNNFFFIDTDFTIRCGSNWPDQQLNPIHNLICLTGPFIVGPRRTRSYLQQTPRFTTSPCPTTSFQVLCIQYMLYNRVWHIQPCTWQSLHLQYQRNNMPRTPLLCYLWCFAKLNFRVSSTLRVCVLSASIVCTLFWLCYAILSFALDWYAVFCSSAILSSALDWYAVFCSAAFIYSALD